MKSVWLAGIVAIGVSAGSLPSPASALTILARCGPSTGQSYYFEAGAVKPGTGGWRKDGFDGGRITFLIDDSGKLDVIFRDADGIRSYTAQNIVVTAQGVDASSRSFLVTAAKDKLIETYVVKLDENGIGTLIWTSSKTTSAFVKTSVMQSVCGPQYEITSAK